MASDMERAEKLARKFFADEGDAVSRQTIEECRVDISIALAAVRAETIEQAAKVAEKHDAFTGYRGDDPLPEHYADTGTMFYARGNYNARVSIAQDIRALNTPDAGVKVEATGGGK